MKDLVFLVTGANGQLGYDVVKELNIRKITVFSSGTKDVNDNFYIKLDITDRESVIKTIRKIHPDVIIHCAAWTNVDGAELEENKEDVYNINYYGTKNIVDACKITGSELFYISTDYVFNDSTTSAISSDSLNFNPINIYGDSKLKGELEVRTLEKYFIARISWVFGLNGNNFVKTMLRVSSRDSVSVVNDQIGTPTFTEDAARLIIDIALSDKYGCYNITNEGGYISWYDFCKKIYELSEIKTPVIPISSDKYISKAKRPMNSRLDKSKILDNGFTPLPTWEDALSRFLKEYRYDRS